MKPKQLLDEVHNRSIWQLLAVYFGGAGGILGWADTITSRSRLPDSLFTVSLILLVVGFAGLLGIRFWLSVPRPNPVGVRRAGVFGVVYVIFAWGSVTVAGQLSQQGFIPDVVYHTSLLIAATFLPVAMALGYLQAIKRHLQALRQPEAPATSTEPIEPISSAQRRAVRTAGISGAVFFFFGWMFVSVVDQLDQQLVLPEIVYPIVLTSFLVLLPVVVVLGYTWRKRRTIPDAGS